MFCTNCGKSIREGALFCSNCGVKLQTPQSADAQIMEAEFLRREEEARRQAEMAHAEELRREAEARAEEARAAAEFRRLAEQEYNRQRENRIKEIEAGIRNQYISEANKAKNVENFRAQAITAMVLGIASLEVAVLGVPGWVLSTLAKSKARPIVEEYKGTSIFAFANAGFITGKVALPLSIVMSVIWTIYAMGIGMI